MSKNIPSPYESVTLADGTKLTDCQAADAELSALVERERRLIAIIQENHDPGSLTALRANSFNWIGLGAYSLALGRDDEASVGFMCAANGYEQWSRLLHPPGQMAYYEAILYYLVANTEESLRKVRQLAGQPAPADDKKITEPFRWGTFIGDRLDFARFIPALLAGDDVSARELAQHAQATEPKKLWYPGLGDAMRGLVDADRAVVDAGFTRILQKHGKKAVSKKSDLWGSGYRYVCLPALALGILAQHRSGWEIAADFPGRVKRLEVTLAWALQDLGLQTGKLYGGRRCFDFVRAPTSEEALGQGPRVVN